MQHWQFTTGLTMTHMAIWSILDTWQRMSAEYFQCLARHVFHCIDDNRFGHSTTHPRLPPVPSQGPLHPQAAAQATAVVVPVPAPISSAVLCAYLSLRKRSMISCRFTGCGRFLAWFSSPQKIRDITFGMCQTVFQQLPPVSNPFSLLRF